MKIYTVKTYDEMSRKAANIIAAQMILKPNSVLGLATGSTPVGAYKNLIEANKNGDIDFSEITTINLDEYQGLDGNHDQSYRYFMNDNLFNHVNIRKECTYVPDGTIMDAEAACKAHEDIIRTSGGIDLQLLGIGGNGHIAFNEPCDHFPAETHVVELTQETREANSRFFASIDEVPTHAYTMGIGSIMSAKKILLLANGEAKAQALYDTIYGLITPQVPASVLQLHPDVTIIADEAAMSVIKEKGK